MSCGHTSPWRRRSLATKRPAAIEETLEVPATPEQLNAIHAALARFWDAAEGELLPPPGSAWRHAFDTAVAEMATNIIRHAYPGEKGLLRLRLRCEMGAVRADFTDSGVPFQQRLPEARAVPAEREDLPEGGFGLDLIRAFVDTLDYRRTPNGTNRWLLVKRASSGFRGRSQPAR